MSKYKAGDKVVLEIIECNDNLLCVSGKSGKRWFLENHVEDFAKPLSEYTEKLEKKNKNKQERIEKLVDRLHNQAAEITRLLAENEDLKNSMEIIRDNAFEAGQVKGQNDAWELATRIALDEMFGGYKGSELKEIFGLTYLPEIFRLTYSEAAVKVAEWERKQEICVGDVVECEGHHGVVVGAGEVYVKGFTSDWTPFQWMKQSCTKTGRHIDIASMLAQIGDER